jgi:hypothetical protein
MKRALVIGDKLTMFSISEFTATCFRHEVIVKEVRENNRVVMCERGKRKLFMRDISSDSILLLEGHGLKLKADTETGSFWGNACFNLVGESRESIIDILDKTSVKEITPGQRGNLMFKLSTAPDNFEESNDLLYPETLEEA